MSRNYKYWQRDNWYTRRWKPCNKWIATALKLIHHLLLLLRFDNSSMVSSFILLRIHIIMRVIISALLARGIMHRCSNRWQRLDNSPTGRKSAQIRVNTDRGEDIFWWIPLSACRYQVAIGSTPGGTQLRRFEDVKTEELTVVVRGLDLSRERHVFATVKGFNAAGLHSTATSDGVYVSLLSSGKTPLGESYVYDGNDKAKDV